MVRAITKAISVKIDRRTAATLTWWRDQGINVTTAVISCIRYGLAVKNPLRPSYDRGELEQIGLRIQIDLLKGVDTLAEQWSASRSEMIDVLIQVTIADGIAGVRVPLTVFLPTPTNPTTWR